MAGFEWANAMKVEMEKSESSAFKTFVRRQSPSSSSASASGSASGDLTPGGTGEIFSYPFITLAVVAVAVFVLIGILIAVRMTIWNRRARMNSMDSDNGFASSMPFSAASLPPDPIQPPPILKKKVVEVPQAVASPTGPYCDWSLLQPVSVCFDKQTSESIHATINPTAGSETQTNWTPDLAQVQVTLLISLPTSRTTFPARLRRRNTRDLKSNIFSPLFNGSSVRPSYEADLTGDLSNPTMSKRPVSVHSRASVKELSDARRDAYFENLEKEAQPDESGFAPPQPNLTRPSSRSSLRTEHVNNDAPLDSVGIFAFGSAIMPIHPTPNNDSTLENAPITTKAEIMSLLDHGSRLQNPTKY
ncbi:hypothetical protein MYAM1_001951 [Malassezia yamatoensis]|uniref:Transmembrane protein n=1 Tax=Malassezia yamatoensis TaxID=253288 RepID=A0AAJ6CGB9_9BASI|nr:hypothetical protein MYAM1_001951 [Malassezia yamatoensis]